LRRTACLDTVTRATTNERANDGKDVLGNRLAAEVAHAFFRESGAAVIIVDPSDLSLIDVNSVVLRFTELTRHRLLGSHLSELVETDMPDGDRFEAIRPTETFHSHDFQTAFLQRRSTGTRDVARNK
jgi:PAS domain-containing protein